MEHLTKWSSLGVYPGDCKLRASWPFHRLWQFHTEARYLGRPMTSQLRPCPLPTSGTMKAARQLRSTSPGTPAWAGVAEGGPRPLGEAALAPRVAGFNRAGGTAAPASAARRVFPPPRLASLRRAAALTPPLHHRPPARRLLGSLGGQAALRRGVEGRIGRRGRRVKREGGRVAREAAGSGLLKSGGVRGCFLHRPAL